MSALFDNSRALWSAARGVLANKRARKRALDDAAWFRGWFSGFRFEHSGVPAERYLQVIVSALTPTTLSVVRASADAGDDLSAVKRLLNAAEVKALKARPRLVLRRLEATLRAIARGFAAPKRSAPAYEPVEGRVFYLLHMRRPFEMNGYVARTELVMRAMEMAGLEPEPITRLGFPNDLARHKAATILEEERLEGRLYRALIDGKGGQLGRPIDEYIRAYANRIVATARVRRPAAIYAASSFMNGLAGVLAARTLGVPCVYEMRGLWHVTQASLDPAFENTLRYKVQHTLEIESARRADQVIAISEPLKEWLVEQGVPGERISVVPNVADLTDAPVRDRDGDLADEYGLTRNDVVIGYVGSVTRYEGLDLVLRALAELSKAAVGPSLRFLVVGDGAELAALKDLAEQIGVSESCRFVGRVAPERVADFYGLIDIAPFPRRSMGVTELIPPLKPFEAMAAGKAVIVSNVRAMEGMVDDRSTGIIVQKDDVASLAAAIERLAADGELRRSLGGKARASVAGRHDVSAMSRAIGSTFAALRQSPTAVEPIGYQLLDDAIGLVTEAGGAASLRDLASEFALSTIGDDPLRRALQSTHRHASERGLTKTAAEIADVRQSRDDESGSLAVLMSQATASLVSAGDKEACASFLSKLLKTSLDDRVAMAALDGAAREAGRLRDQEFEAKILMSGLERFGGSPGFVWRTARAAHRAGDYVVARRLAPRTEPPDKRAAEMMLDFGELDALPEAVRALTAAPRSYGDFKEAPTSVLYSVFNAFPYATGGYATRTHGLMSALRASGVPLKVLVRPGAVKNSKGPNAEWRHDIDDVPYIYSHGEVSSGRFRRSRQLTELLQKAIESHSPTIMHSASNFENGLPSAMAAAVTGRPSIYEVRGFWEITRLSHAPAFIDHPLFRRNMCAEIATCLLADRIVTLNAGMKDLLVDCGVSENAIDLVPNAAPTDLFHPRPRNSDLAAKLGFEPDDVVVGYIGSFLPYEGIELLIEAFDMLAPDHPRLKLILVGDHEPAGPRSSDYYDLIRGMAHASAYRDRIVLHPRVPYHEVPELYSVIDISPFPRRSMIVTELVSPMKPREAMAMGRAVAVSSVGGLRSLVDPERTGLVFAPDDAQDLARCLARLVDDTELRLSLAANALEDTRTNGSWSTSAARLREAYEASAESRFRDPAVWSAAGREAARLFRVDADPKAAQAIIAAVTRRLRTRTI